MEGLLRRLEELNASEAYPFHMPGHKRNPDYPHFKEAFGLDITEIEGFGDLYSNEGILEDLKDKAAKVFGAKRAFVLVNGSTVGVLSAISAAVSRRGKLILADNAHRSAFNAVYLNELREIDISPPVIRPYMTSGGISPACIAEALDREPDAEAVFITSPTYEGIISDVSGIAGVCHDRNKILITDSAHGAYLGFERESALRYNAHNAVEAGADIVVESLHKTLPCFTQTALLFVNGNRVDEEKLARYVGIYQTSSPSYLFMAGISECLDFVERNRDRFRSHFEAVERLRNAAAELKNINIAGRELTGDNGVYGIDPYKLMIRHERISGHELMELLSHRYKLIMELCTPEYVLAMTSPMDTKEGFERLERALRELDKEE